MSLFKYFLKNALFASFVHFFKPHWKAEVKSLAAIYKATSMHNIIQMQFRHGRHILAPMHAGRSKGWGERMLLPKQRENFHEKTQQFIHQLSA